MNKLSWQNVLPLTDNLKHVVDEKNIVLVSLNNDILF